MESIARRWRQIKQGIRQLTRHPAASDVVLVMVITLVGFGAFGLGRLSALDQPEVALCTLPSELRKAAGQVKSAVTQTDMTAPVGALVGSVNSDVYHAQWCPGAERINDANKVYFKSAAIAKKAGYRPAKNCPGL